MLRFPNFELAVNDKRLSAWGAALNPSGGVEFVFNELTTNRVALTYRWSASVEKYSDVVKQWPELSRAVSEVSRSSRRVLRVTH